MSDAERIAYIIGWLHGFEPLITPRFNFCPNCGKRVEVSDG